MRPSTFCWTSATRSADRHDPPWPPIADDVGLLDKARTDLGSRWWWKRLHAVRLLTALGPQSDEYGPLLDDRAPEVRAQAATWAAGDPTPEAIRRLADMVSDEDGRCRFAARTALIDIGLPAVPEIARLLASDDEQVVTRTLPVAAAMSDARADRTAPAADRKRVRCHPGRQRPGAGPKPPTPAPRSS